MVNGTISSSLILSNNRSINGTFIYYRHLIQYIGPRRPPRGSFSTCANFCAISLTYFGNSNPKTNISVCNEFVFNTTFSLRISRSGVRISPGAPLNPLLSEISSSHVKWAPRSLSVSTNLRKYPVRFLPSNAARQGFAHAQRFQPSDESWPDRTTSGNLIVDRAAASRAQSVRSSRVEALFLTFPTAALNFHAVIISAGRHGGDQPAIARDAKIDGRRIFAIPAMHSGQHIAYLGDCERF